MKKYFFSVEWAFNQKHEIHVFAKTQNEAVLTAAQLAVLLSENKKIYSIEYLRTEEGETEFSEAGLELLRELLTL